MGGENFFGDCMTHASSRPVYRRCAMYEIDAGRVAILSGKSQAPLTARRCRPLCGDRLWLAAPSPTAHH